MSEIKVLCIVLAIMLILSASIFFYCKSLKDNYPQETFPIPTYTPTEETTIPEETIGFVPSPEPTIPEEGETIASSESAPTETEPTAPVVETTLPSKPTPTPPPVTETLPPEVEETEEPSLVPTVLTVETERDMLACVIYQEAGWSKSCDECRKRVGDIVLNRVNSPLFPNTIYEVLTAPSQYGLFHWTGIKWPANATPSSASVARSYAAADAILTGNHSDVYDKGYVWQAEFVQGSSGFWCCGTYYGAI